MTNHTADEGCVDLEIRIFPSDASAAGYPVEITLGGQQEFSRGVLAQDIVPWVPSGDPVADGQKLFEALLADSASQSAWNLARGQAPRRRIRLRIAPAVAELHALPWESLQDGPIALAAHANTPFSRYMPIALPWSGPVEERPIRALVVISNPQDLESRHNLASVDVALEQKILKSAFESDELEADFLDTPVTLEKLEAALRDGGHHVLHFVGHGAFNSRRGQAALYMQDEEGDAQHVLDDELVSLLARQSVQPHLVTLVACQSATRSSADAFAGMAPKLVSVGVPAVVAMQDVVTMETARRFIATFYQRLLAHGYVDQAINEARSTLLTARRADAVVPVLFSRLPDNQLLAPLTGDAAPVIKISHFEPETIYVPPGPFLMGSQEAEGIPACETPQHTVDLPAYRIGKYPVTNEQYAEFVHQSGHMVAPQSGWEGQHPPDGRFKHPVLGVTWYDALAYCEWLSKQTGRQYSLPSEAQWEKAARGTDGRVYPWGDEWDAGCCNYGNSQITPVNAYLEGVSPYGCYDMVGNVREWTCTLWGEKRKEPDPRFCYPWADDGRNDLAAQSNVRRVYRGGAAADKVSQLRCGARGAYAPDKPGPPRKRHGFRVVLSIWWEEGVSQYG